MSALFYHFRQRGGYKISYFCFKQFMVFSKIRGVMEISYDGFRHFRLQFLAFFFLKKTLRKKKIFKLPS